MATLTRRIVSARHAPLPAKKRATRALGAETAEKTLGRRKREDEAQKSMETTRFRICQVTGIEIPVVVQHPPAQLQRKKRRAQPKAKKAPPKRKAAPLHEEEDEESAKRARSDESTEAETPEVYGELNDIPESTFDDEKQALFEFQRNYMMTNYKCMTSTSTFREWAMGLCIVEEGTTAEQHKALIDRFVTRANSIFTQYMRVHKGGIGNAILLGMRKPWRAELAACLWVAMKLEEAQSLVPVALDVVEVCGMKYNAITKQTTVQALIAQERILGKALNWNFYGGWLV